MTCFKALVPITGTWNSFILDCEICGHQLFFVFDLVKFVKKKKKIKAIWFTENNWVTKITEWPMSNTNAERKQAQPQCVKWNKKYRNQNKTEGTNTITVNKGKK